MRTTVDLDSTRTGVLTILNQLYILENKARKLPDSDALLRHFDRIREQFSLLGYSVEDPVGQPYDETRTDCEASIAGESTEDLVITEVIKPLIRCRDGEFTAIAQRAVVVVQNRDPNTN